MPSASADPRLLRLLDLGPTDVIKVKCVCGKLVLYAHGFLPRHHRIPSDTLVYDLQYRLRCKHCNRRDGFEISVVDQRHLGDSSKPQPRTVIVSGE
jgi:hypothetical protein